MSKLEQIKEILDKAQEQEVKLFEIEAYGYQYNYKTNICKSISKYGFFESHVNEMIAPLNSESNNKNRCGNLLETIEYITIHDTASAAPTADELAHAKYVNNGGAGTSWHYSIGESIYHQIPDNEVCYHAGDGTTVRFSLTKTIVKATTKKPIVDIEEGYYTLNGEKSNIEAPKYNDGNVLTKNDINDAGIRVDITEDGFYAIGTTYYNSGYKKIANRGGNNNSIGIETMVNQGSDLMKVWHVCAKHVAKLLVDNNLTPDRVKPHHFFSGKNCPMTMRKNNLWQYFLDCVNIEYQMLCIKKDYQIILKHNSKLIDENGYIILDNVQDDVIDYQVIVKNDIEEMTLNYQIKIKK